MRITNQMVTDRMLAQLALTQRRLSDVQERVGSGQRITRPADDPLGASRLMAARTELERNQQYDRNIAVALSDLATTEGALVGLTDLLQRASELAVQGANDTLDASARQIIALEIEELLEGAIAIGNRSHVGRRIFAGQKTDTAPYVPDIPNNPTVVTYDGDTGLIEREISKGSRIAVNITGDRVLPQLFATLIQFRDDLAGNDVTALNADVAALDAQIDAVLDLRSEIGAKMRRIEMARTRLEDDQLRLRTLLAEIGQVDLAQTIVELQSQETAYQAALGVAARAFGLNLLDFLR